MADEGGGLNLKFLIIIVILVIIIATGTSFMILTYYNSNGEEGDTKKEEMGPNYELGDFVVNLSLENSYNFLKTNIVVEVSKKDVIDEIEKRSPQIKDIIISILREQKMEDIKQPAADIIKDKIKISLNNVLQSGEIFNVWFTEFVVQ